MYPDLDPLQAVLDAAVLDSARWQDVCDEIAAVFGGIGTIIAPESVDHQLPGMTASSSLDELLGRVWREGWTRRNYRRRALPIVRQRGYFTDYDIADDSVMAREPFYTELISPLGLGVSLGLYIPGPHGNFIAGIERSRRVGPPDDDLLGLAARVQPMLASSARASMALAGQRVEDWRALAAESNAAVLLIDRLGQVIDRTERTEGLVGSLFDLGERRIRLLGVGADQRFAELLEALRQPDERTPLPPPLLVRGNWPGRMMIDGVRLPRSLRFFHVDAAAMIVVRPVEGEAQILDRALRHHAHLTDAELRVALALFEGLSPQDYADQASLAVGTVRQQVKSVLRKTGTGRQGELLTLMRRLSKND